MIRFIFLLITFCILFFVSCSSGSSTANPLLHDIWALESIEGEAFVRDSDSIRHPMIEIHLNDENIIGNTGCNNLDGKVNVAGNKISFSEMVTTKMFCPKDTEQKLLSALGRANNYKIEKMRLYLFDDDNELLVFKKID